MGRGYEEVLDEILFFHLRARYALAAASLFSIARYREALYITGVAYRNHHVLFGDQVLYVELLGFRGYLRPPLVAEFLGQFFHLVLYYLKDFLIAGKDGFIKLYLFY